ncbi:MAG: histidine phosphatase family protein [Pirellulales bacterium]
MPNDFPILYVARHGETEWSITGQHTGRADIPLTKRGEQMAAELGARLHKLSFTRVYTSPLIRAAETCRIAGYAAVADSMFDLVEWAYGEFEGRRRAEIRADYPDWDLFRDGCPGGESPAEVGERADRVIAAVTPLQGNVLLFSSGHFLRVLAARWLDLPPGMARHFHLSTASLSELTYEHSLAEPVISLWNDVSHLGAP